MTGRRLFAQAVLGVGLVIAAGSGCSMPHLSGDYGLASKTAFQAQAKSVPDGQAGSSVHVAERLDSREAEAVLVQRRTVKKATTTKPGTLESSNASQVFDAK
ncbi:MAG: hypothetical protein V2A73_08470 [Pseudomonadota bacterium]